MGHRRKRGREGDRDKRKEGRREREKGIEIVR